MFINKVLIYGNLTRDPEIKTLPSGSAVANFSLATNRTYNDRDGNKKEEVEYHNLVCFGKQAENLGKYMKKGDGLFIEGRLQTRSWEKDGRKNYRTEIIAERVQFGPRKMRQETIHEESTPPPQDIPPEQDISIDDIPF